MDIPELVYLDTLDLALEDCQLRFLRSHTVVEIYKDFKLVCQGRPIHCTRGPPLLFKKRGKEDSEKKLAGFLTYKGYTYVRSLDLQL